MRRNMPSNPRGIPVEMVEWMHTQRRRYYLRARGAEESLPGVESAYNM